MATSSPFSFLDPLFDKASSVLKPPPAVVREVQQRLVLLLNHVLMQEPEAMARLMRHSKRSSRLQWRDFTIDLMATPAGLLDLAPPGQRADLLLAVDEASATGLIGKALTGEKPQVRIEGDVQLAAEVNWLVDHVRWDIEEDLSRVMGDVAAHRLASIGRESTKALRLFVQSGFKRTPAA
ncbi:MAG: hypothetical protein KA045_02415 [Burkholderiaceae bacterium]|jgi:ubiquinone biosynthesis protein UbiJ|nr:hypothetical protein [Burkholderiaceae bacterium]